MSKIIKKGRPKKQLFPKKAHIIYIVNDDGKDIYIAGKGTVDAHKTVSGEIVFTGILRKIYD